MLNKNFDPFFCDTFVFLLKSHSNYLKSDDKPYMCEDCEKRFFSVHSLSSIYLEHPYMGDGLLLCYACIMDREKGFIEGEPLARLPLYINHKWVTFDGFQIYKSRLREAVV